MAMVLQWVDSIVTVTFLEFVGVMKERGEGVQREGGTGVQRGRMAEGEVSFVVLWLN